MNNHQFLDFERSFKLWELRYAEPFLAWYSKTGALFLADVYVAELDDDKQIRAVLKQQAFDWFRKRGYDSWSYLNTNGMYSGVVVKDGKSIGVGQFEDYDDSVNARIDKIIELIQKIANA